jgi:hypothetical protein
MSFRLLRRGLHFFVHLQAGYETFHPWTRWLVGRPGPLHLMLLWANW